MDSLRLDYGTAAGVAPHVALGTTVVMLVLVLGTGATRRAAS
ncbi:hypothetical protein [Streptomyces sp. CB02488]|nr:hypothetical protein [Streptomyces sp. CB02488]